jgi:hypothetical protein
MPTKDPHIALIDAHEKLHRIKVKLREAMALLKSKASRGQLSQADLLMVMAIQREATDATRRVQDELYEELESHER